MKRYAPLVIGLLLLGLSGSLGGLVLADAAQTDGRLSPRARLERALDNGDHLHYAVHLVAGRILDLCPCTEEQAQAEYWRASFHARTQRQLALVTDERPTTPQERFADSLSLTAGGLSWLGDAAQWLKDGAATQVAAGHP